MGDGSQLVARYYIFGKKYNIFGCWDNETPENQFDFFDVFNEQGICLNEGEPFYSMPTYNEVMDLVELTIK